MSYLIQSRRLCKRLGEKNLLSDVEVHVPQGRVYALLGPNGAGKTTLMRLVLNLWKPTSGEMELFGAPLRPGDCAPLGRMGSIIEFPAFFEMLNGLENLRLHCAYMGYHRPGAAEEALERLGLGAAGNKKVKHYSLGMRQRLGLARAVLTHPELLVLDEPANALDAAGMKQVRDLLRTLCRDWGTTVFLSSHLLSEVEQIADTVGILHRGRLLREISLSELAAQSLTYIELVTPDVRAAARVLEELGVRRFKVLQEGVVRIYEAPMAPEELSRALALQNVVIASFQKHADTLEDYYLRLTGEEN